MFFVRADSGNQALTASCYSRAAVSAILLILLWPAGASTEEVRVAGSLDGQLGHSGTLRITFDLPESHYLYADMLELQVVSGARASGIKLPSPLRMADAFSGEEKDVYMSNFTAAVILDVITADVVRIRVGYQACTRDVCFLPVSTELVLYAQSGPPENRAAASASGVGGTEPKWKELARRFQVMGRSFGYMGEDEFATFVQESLRSDEGSGAPSVQHRGWWATLAVVFLGGLALNLTPCVLPLIPVNLAIIGAVSTSGTRRSRTRGFLMGTAYGGGMAIAYGVLGIVAVVSGGMFGALNSSPWFNAVIGVLFLLLALAMFDVIHVDFSRWGSRFTPQTIRRGGILIAIVSGAVAAVLAGACVAPIVISVLVWSAKLYAEGNASAAVLPLLLGAGMASPWPLLGAGITALPKPGRWMIWVRNILGVAILLLSAYYGQVAYGLLRARHAGGGAVAAAAPEQQLDQMSRQLLQAVRGGRPVLLEFGASWCKACTAMERTTLQSPRIKKLLQDFVVIKVAAEDPRHPTMAELLEFYEVPGLPAYLILSPQVATSGTGG